jgi:hypothetical protein
MSPVNSAAESSESDEDIPINSEKADTKRVEQPPIEQGADEQKAEEHKSMGCEWRVACQRSNSR